MESTDLNKFFILERAIMSSEFNESAKAHVNRDEHGIVRDLLHVEERFL
jgi:hypothetical protein